MKYTLLNPKKHLVHGDYYFTNVLVYHEGNMQAILDFSAHTTVGDVRMDAASINFLSLCPTNMTAEQMAFVQHLLVEMYGKHILPFVDLYGFYYAFYFSDTYLFDHISYEWCLSILNDDDRWKHYTNSLSVSFL